MAATTVKLQIERRTGLTHSEFVNEYRNPIKPVILTDVSNKWKASKTFFLEYFKDNFGAREGKIAGKYYNLSEFIELLNNSTREEPALYPCILKLHKDFAEFETEIEPKSPIKKHDRAGNSLLPRILVKGISYLADLEVFLGGSGGEFPILHYVLLGVNTFVNQLNGEKEFTFFTPDQQKYLYPKEESPHLSAIENHHNPDLTKYPLFANTTQTTVIISAGESLFIPSGWYHTARSLTLTISIQLDQLCQSNWEFFMNECCITRRKSPLKAKMIYMYLASLGDLITARERLMGTR
jgi:hypothetical protein